MSKRAYRQHCGLARALDVVGSRWTLLIVRNLLLGPQRFTDLQRGLPGITTNLLTDRLREMEADGILERVRTPPPVRVAAYALTDRGRALEPAIHELGRWGWPYMASPSPDDHVDAAWGMLALKRRFVPGHGAAVVEITTADTAFTVSLDDDGPAVRRGASPEADARVRAEWPTLASVLYAGASVADLETRGALEVDGSRAALETFVRAFELAG